MNRAEVLDRVKEIITKDRAETHGEAVLQLTSVQQIKAVVGHRESSKLTLAEIEAIDCICIKLSRLVNGKPSTEHWEDIIGYAAIAVEARSLADLAAAEEVDTSSNDLSVSVSPPGSIARWLKKPGDAISELK